MAAQFRVDGAVSDAEIQTRLGLARLTQLAFQGANLAETWNELLAAVTQDPTNAAALMDLSVLAQLLGNAETGIDLQTRALDIAQFYRSPRGAGPSDLRLLAIAAATDIGGNIPLEFLLAGSDIDLVTLYLKDNGIPAALPEHDVAIIAMGNAERASAALRGMERRLAHWPKPILNLPANILGLERDRLCELLRSVPGLECARTVRVARARLAAVAAGDAELEQMLEGDTFPIIARPIDSHAGKGLEKIDEREQLLSYLIDRPEAEFFIARFIDYSSADGLYRKYRVVFIDGAPFAVHMAITDLWKVWYLNANMHESAAKRGEEARFMATFDTDFAARHRRTFEELVTRIGLDYFGIDCAETRDGKLVLFEGETALIVHDMDPPDVYPYKGPAMRKLFAAFVAMLRRRAGKAA
jgi:hypothetical protein